MPHLVKPSQILPSQTPFATSYIHKMEFVLRTQGQVKPLSVRFNCTLKDGTVIYDTHPDDVYAPYIVYAAINLGWDSLYVNIIPVNEPYKVDRVMNTYADAKKYSMGGGK